MKNLEKINVVEVRDNGTIMGDRFQYIVKCEEIKDYEKTSSLENVAWNGTLILYKSRKNKFYLWHHSGNGNHTGYGKKVSEIYSKSIEKISSEEAMEIYLIL